MKYLLYFILLAVVVISMATGEKRRRDMNQGSARDRAQVYGTIFAYYYDTDINPDNVKVNVSILLQGYKLDVERNVLETDVWISMEWNDDRLQWNPLSYNGLAVLRVNPEKIWKPDLSLYNSADSVTQMNCWQSRVVLDHKGDISWINPCKLQSYCKFNLKTNPYADQTCMLRFGSWTMDGNAMDLQIKDKNKKIQTDTLTNPPGWQYVSSTAERNSQVYECCEEPYIDITYNVTLRRAPQYLSTI